MSRFMVSLPSAFLKRVDHVARSQNRSRSELIREALRIMLKAEDGRGNSWQHSLAPLRDLERQWTGQWDSTDTAHYYRDRWHGREARR